jgi:hypothetical protein
MKAILTSDFDPGPGTLTYSYVFVSHPSCTYKYFFGRLECVGHSFAYVAHFVFLRDVWKYFFVQCTCFVYIWPPENHSTQSS